MLSLRNRHLFLIDAAFLPLVAALSFAIRFEELAWPEGVAATLAFYVALAVPLKLAVMWRFGLYSRLWRYASTRDLGVLASSVLGAAVISSFVGLSLMPMLRQVTSRAPISVVVLDSLLTAMAVAGPRLLARVGRRLLARGPAEGSKRALIVGAGAAGSMIVRELLDNPRLALNPVAVLDDDPSKRGRLMHGIPVAGRLSELEAIARRFDIAEVIIAMPSARGDVIRAVVTAAGPLGVPTRTVPGVYEIIQGGHAVSALREVAIEDLLRREPVRTDMSRVRSLAHRKTVLVTGAGGSIGGELCRQIAQLDPARLIAVGRGENSIFELMQELRRTFPHANVEPVIADVRDRARMEQLFRRTAPNTVFHAAAHKHVPLMEANVGEAILNNVLETQVVADLAWRYGTERFVLISSDKAVRPSSVMGATKRLAEGVVQGYSGTPGRNFVSVRFGNVLGSRGSVIPTFLRQIRAGGPVTITHREMQRYFMTIPEAVQLVLQAGTMAEGSEVFVLDMGEPVRIYDLARDVIRLSGLKEGVDIEIRETGIRPGEKLYEELFFDAEHAMPTSHPKVLKARNALLDLDGAHSVDDLIALARRSTPPAELRSVIRSLVPEYTGAEPLPAPTPVRSAIDSSVPLTPAMTFAPSAP